MRIPVSLGWLMLLLCFFTAGLLRQFHDQTPVSPFAPAVVGSALFAAIFLLLLVHAREWRVGAVRGAGVRLGSLTPLLLMLLIEKWFSQSVYPPLARVLGLDVNASALDSARYVVIAGVGLILLCILIAPLSRPASRKTWRRARPTRIFLGSLAALFVAAGTYLVLAILAAALGAPIRFTLPELNPLLAWVLFGQLAIAFGEELYYRGHLLNELERLAPRLGARQAAIRRWTALLFTSAMFALEHVNISAPMDILLRESVFTLSLGLLFGLLVMMSANLYVAIGIHFWINALLIGAAPHFERLDGQPFLDPGAYIGIGLVLAFGLAVAVKQMRRAGLLHRLRLGKLPT